jgi:hypothetical protein
MSDILDELAFMQFLKVVHGYRDPRPLGNGRDAAISPLLFTHAIIVGRIGDVLSYDDRWCSHTYEAALSALEAWDGVGDPAGWHPHPLSGRRRQDGDLLVEYVTA